MQRVPIRMPWLVGLLKGVWELMHLLQDSKEMQEVVGLIHLKRLVQRTWMSPFGVFPASQATKTIPGVCGRAVTLMHYGPRQAHDVPIMEAVAIVHRLQS